MSRTTVQTVAVEPEKTMSAMSNVQLDNDEPEGSSPPRQIWWTNAIFFIAFHVVGLSAWYTWPSSWRTWFLCYINWQLGTLGITIGISPDHD
jgi:fatty-acid desaturase